MKAITEYTSATNPQKIRLIRGCTVLATMLLLTLVAPLVWTVVSAAVGIASLAGLTIVGIATFQALPMVMQKLENHVLQARKTEARTNPIEQLQNEVLRRAKRLQLFRQALVTVGGQIESISELLVECRQRDPGHVLDRQERALQRLQQFYSVNQARLANAQMALEEFRCTVDRKASEWNIALAIDEASELLDPNTTNNLMQNLLTDSALRSVQDRFNKVFAELDMQMSSLDGPTRKFMEDFNLKDIEALHLTTHSTARRST